MKDFDTSSTDAQYWANQLEKIHGFDSEIMVGWFANYWAAIHDPLTKRIKELENDRYQG